MDFITFILGSFQSFLKGVFTLIVDLLVICVSNFYKGYSMVHLLCYIISVLFYWRKKTISLNLFYDEEHSRVSRFYVLRVVLFKVSLPGCVSQSAGLCESVCPSVRVSLPICMSQSAGLRKSVCPSVLVSLPVCASQSACLWESVCPSVWVSLPVCVSQSAHLCESVSRSVLVSLPICISFIVIATLLNYWTEFQATCYAVRTQCEVAYIISNF